MKPPLAGRGDDGAYMVLYALLAVVVFTLVAIVLDLAALRQGRRADRTAADLAATAGAGAIDPFDPSSHATACRAAWDYLVLNLESAEGTITAPDCATAFPPTACDPLVATTTTGTVGPLTVAITFPVPDASELMRSEVGGGDLPQAIDTAHDGDPCHRMGVRVVRERAFLFGGIAGVDRGRTDVHAVARRTLTSSPDVPAVVALERTGCDGVATTAAFAVAPPPLTTPNEIVVDTDLSSCSGGVAIRAEPLASITAGRIEAFALSGSAAARTSTGIVVPTPSRVNDRLGRGFLDARYNCGATCNEPVGALDALRAAYGGPGNAGLPVHSTCSVASGTTEAVTGDVFVDCASYVVDGRVTFTGATIVFNGDVVVGPSGCLAVNDGSCASPVAIGAGHNEVAAVLRGSLSKADRGDVVLARTFVLAAGSVTFPRGSNDPLATSRVHWTAPLTGAFEDLLLWSDTVGEVVLGEQRTLTMDGTVAAPTGRIVLRAKSGSAGVYGTQLVGRTIEVRGTQPVAVQPSATRATGRVARAVKLIR